MIGMLVVYLIILGMVFAALASLVKAESDRERWKEGLDPDVNLVLTLGDEPGDLKEEMRDMWGRLHNSRVFRLPKRRRVRANGGRLAIPLPQWD